MSAFHDPSFARWNDPARSTVGFVNRFSDESDRTANTPENRGGVTTVAFPPKSGARGQRVVLNSELLLREPFATALEDEDDRYVLYIYQPNMRKKDLELSMSGDILHIKGQRTLRGVTYEFKREIALPQDADGSQIEAEYQTGRINITIPKVSAKKIHRSIPIEGVPRPEKKQAESKQETEKEKQEEPSTGKRSIPISGETATGTSAAAGTGDTSAGSAGAGPGGAGAGAGAGSTSGSDKDTGGGIESPLQPRPPQEGAQQEQAQARTSESQVPAESQSEPPPLTSDVSLSGHDVAIAKQRLEEEQKTHQLEQDIKQHKPHLHSTQAQHHQEGQHEQPQQQQPQQQQGSGTESETQPSTSESIKLGLSLMTEKVKSTLGAAIGKGEQEKTSSSSTEKS